MNEVTWPEPPVGHEGGPSHPRDTLLFLKHDPTTFSHLTVFPVSLVILTKEALVCSSRTCGYLWLQPYMCSSRTHAIPAIPVS